MHHCLTVPELVDEITSHCYQSSLANLARTARLFDCALDKLWTGITLQELILCFSSEVVKISRHYYGPPLTLLKHPEPRHWDRFHFYGKRVRDIKLYTHDLDDAFIDVLCLCAPQGGLLPQLRTCSLYASHLAHVQILWAFISPILKELSLTIGGKPEVLRDPVSTSFLASIPSLCPELMKLTADWPSGDYFPHFPAFLQSFQNLQELDIEGVDISHFPVITRLSRLTSLTMICQESCATPPSEPIVKKWRFLQHLHVTSSTNSLHTLLCYISKCPMEDIHLIIEDGTWVGLDIIFLAVRDTCKRHPLRRLEIEISSYEIENGPVTTGDSLSPLFDYPNITEFICPFGIFAVADRHISMLARSWPELAILDVNYDGPPRSNDILPTIKSLDYLVRHCPLLRKLSIPFNAMNVDFDVESIPADGASNRLVTKLGVGCSPISQAPSVANYLYSLFPNLRKIVWDVNSRDVSLWEGIEHIIPIIAARVQQQALRDNDQGMKTCPWDNSGE